MHIVVCVVFFGQVVGYSRWPYIVRVCVTKFYPHIPGTRTIQKPATIEGSILRQTISPAQYRTPALYRAT